MRRGSLADLLHVQLDRAGGPSLVRQIVDQLGAAVRTGAIPGGTRLPATRSLGLSLRVSRSSVVAAYEQLAAEGYVSGRGGSGTYVSGDLPDQRPRRPPNAARTASCPGALPAGLSPEGRAAAAFAAAMQPTLAVPFATGAPSADARSALAWRRCVLRHVAGSDAAPYGDPRGLAALRAAMTAHLRATRSVDVAGGSLLVTSGAQGAVSLAARVLVGPGDPVWVEDPCYLPTIAVLRAIGARILAVPVDADGFDIQAALRLEPRARAAFVTPSHQYPTGAVLSMPRRLALVAWARREGGWIVEDDYDGEFRYAGRPLAALQGIGAADRVVYAATVSKALSPGLRLGCALVPRDLEAVFAAARFAGDREPPALTQAALADFMAEGHFAAHIRRQRVAYRARRDACVSVLRETFGDDAAPTVPDQGMHLTLRLRDGIDADAVEAAAAARGVVARSIPKLALAARMPPSLMLGFAGFDDGALLKAARGLRDAVLDVGGQRR